MSDVLQHSAGPDDRSLWCHIVNRDSVRVAALLAPLDPVAAKALVNRGQTYTTHRRSYLHRAVLLQDMEMIRVLLRYGAETRSNDINYLNPLHLACRFSKGIDVVSLLLEFDAAPATAIEALTAANLTPWWYNEEPDVDRLFGSLQPHEVSNDAKQTGSDALFNMPSVTSLRELLDRGCDVNCRDKRTGMTPLLKTVLYPHVPQRDLCIAIYASYGADLKAQFEDGSGALHGARSPSTIVALVYFGADVNLQDNGGVTPLLAHKKQPKLVNALMELNSDPYIGDAAGETILDMDGRTEYLTPLGKSFKKMIGNPQYSDVTLTTISGVTIHAHKVVLAARCPLLHELLQDSSATTIQIAEQISLQQCLYILHYIYTDQVPNESELTKQELAVLPPIADKYGLPRLRAMIMRLSDAATVPRSTFQSDMKSVRSQKLYSDVTFLVEGTEFPAHKMILCSRCTYFEHLFGSGMKESTQETVTMSEISAVAFECLMESIYCNTTESLNDKNAVEMLRVSSIYCMEHLKPASEHEIIKYVDEESVVSLWNIAHFYGAEFLKSYCFHYLTHYHDKVKQANGMEDMTEELQKELQHLHIHNSLSE